MTTARSRKQARVCGYTPHPELGVLPELTEAPRVLARKLALGDSEDERFSVLPYEQLARVEDVHEHFSHRELATIGAMAEDVNHHEAAAYFFALAGYRVDLMMDEWWDPNTWGGKAPALDPARVVTTGPESAACDHEGFGTPDSEIGRMFQ